MKIAYNHPKRWHQRRFADGRRDQSAAVGCYLFEVADGNVHSDTLLKDVAYSYTFIFICFIKCAQNAKINVNEMFKYFYIHFQRTWN